MIFQFTGQPGHGKTLSAILLALKFQDEGRLVYACNIRDLDHEKSGFIAMSPDDFINWTEFLPDGAVCLVDEVYEHSMLPKMPPGSKVPHHVEQLAKHRHRGIDFIFVCQSPKYQVNVFVHDLIDKHYHVRRQFGTKFIIIKEFDHYESNPLKAHPLNKNRTTLPKRPMGMYKSTEMDTTKTSIPWYYFAIPIVFILIIGFSIYSFKRVTDQLSPKSQVQDAGLIDENGASAKVEESSPADLQFESSPVETAQQYVDRFKPRIPSQPWSAPAYDELSLPQNPPRIFCISSGTPTDSCTCITDQGTKYFLDFQTCVTVVRDGQYEPYLDVSNNNSMQTNSQNQLQYINENRTNTFSQNAEVPDSSSQLNGIRQPVTQIGQPAENVRGWINKY
jgi:Zonular occludens toxin (Zot)